MPSRLRQRILTNRQCVSPRRRVMRLSLLQKRRHISTRRLLATNNSQLLCLDVTECQQLHNTSIRSKFQASTPASCTPLHRRRHTHTDDGTECWSTLRTRHRQTQVRMVAAMAAHLPRTHCQLNVPYRRDRRCLERDWLKWTRRRRTCTSNRRRCCSILLLRQWVGNTHGLLLTTDDTHHLICTLSSRNCTETTDRIVYCLSQFAGMSYRMSRNHCRSQGCTQTIGTVSLN